MAVESEIASALRRALRIADYRETGVKRALRVDALPSAREKRASLLRFLRATDDESALSTLVRLFHLHQAVESGPATQSLGSRVLQGLLDAGILSVSNHHELTSAVELCMHKDLIAAADWPSRREPDQVMGIAGTSRALLDLAIRRPLRRSLDLGSGNGIQSLALAEYCKHVTGVDCNKRATAFARFNATLNDSPNITFQTGDLFDSVEGELFELILCNPPFVIAPKGLAPVHTSTGDVSDDFVQSVVKGAASHLTDGGYLQMLANWIERDGEDWQQRLGHWLDHTGCDALLLHSHTETAFDYAFERANEIAIGQDQVGKTFDEWLGSFERERVQGVGFGLLTVRKSNAASPRLAIERLPGVSSDSGAAIELSFHLRDFLVRALDDGVLMASKLRCVRELKWRQVAKRADARWVLLENRMISGGGLPFQIDVESDAIQFVSNCDGKRTVENVLEAIMPTTDYGNLDLRRELLTSVRRLIERGILVPV